MVADSDVAAQFFNSTRRSPEEIERYIAAGGNAEALKQYAVSSLRSRQVIKPDGTVDAKALQRWIVQHEGALSAFPDLKASFASVKAAQETVDTLSAQHAEAVKAFQNGAAKNFLNDDPATAVKKAFGSGNSAETFGKLVQMVRGSADASAGLRRAVVEYIQANMRNAALPGEEEGFYKPEVFRKFVQQHNTALKKLFGGQGVQNLNMVAADIRRSVQAVERTRLPGQSGTSQDAATAGHGHGSGAVTLLMILGEQLGEHLASMGGHEGASGLAIGAAGAAIPYVINSMRQAGIKTIEQLRTEAFLHPELAGLLMSKAKSAASPTIMRRLAIQLQAIAGASAVKDATAQH